MKKTTKTANASKRAEYIRMYAQRELGDNGSTCMYGLLNTYATLIELADKKTFDCIYYDETAKPGHPEIIITDVPDISTEYGTDWDRNGFERKIAGLACAVIDDDGSHPAYYTNTYDLHHGAIDVAKMDYVLTAMRLIKTA